MERRLRCIFLKLATLLLSITGALSQQVWAQPDDDQVVRPEIERRELKEADIDTENFEIGGFAGAYSTEDFGTNFVYGARAAYHVTELIFVEGAYGRTDTSETSFERLSSIRIVDDRTLQYYNVSFGFNLFPGESFIGNKWAFTSDFYLIAGVGSTDFAGDDNFTLNFGAGYKVLLNDWLALRVDARDHVFDVELLGEKDTTHNLEFTGGLSIFF